MKKSYRYIFDKSSKKFECPNCKERRFTKMIDPETGSYIDSKYGRCDRENNCGYEFIPSHEKPKLDTKAPNQIRNVIIFPNGKHEPCLSKHDSPFHSFCKSLGIPEDHLSKWKVGTAGRYTAFGLYNEKGTFLNIKHIPYSEEGKRLRGEKDYPFYLSTKYLKDNEKYEKCFYGLHLYDPQKDTIIVESEKSAILGSFFYPSYNWLATGGNNGVRANHITPLFGGKGRIIYLSDNDNAGTNNKIIERLEKTIGEVSDRLLVVNPFFDQDIGFDIADWILVSLSGKKIGYKITGDLEKDLGINQGSLQINENGEIEKGEKKGGNKKGKAINAATEYILERWGEHLFINELNNRIEYKRQPIDDRFINIIWRECNTTLSTTISQTDINSLLNSDILPIYNPIRDFFECNELTTKGNIEKLAKSINTKTYNEDFATLLLKKWLVGAVANIFEPIIKSPLQLVLYGGQDTGKSFFFRQLLPIDLLIYYAEDKLDNPKDAAQLMCSKILIMDDEYGGKSKHDSKVLKDLISKHEFTIRLPYARMPSTMRRIATLCGTTNEPDILVDTTGNRRIIPMEVQEGDRDFDLYDSIDKTQLWVEVYQLYKSGFRYELTKDEVKQLNDNTGKFERLSLESGLLHKYFRPIPEDECSHLSYKDAISHEFEWMTSTEILLHIKTESKLSRINNIQLGKELKKDGYFQKSHKVKGKVRRYWAVKKIGDGSDMSEYMHPMAHF